MYKIKDLSLSSLHLAVYQYYLYKTITYYIIIVGSNNIDHFIR